MKERPILFSGPMVRAILDGRKTQTRRVVKTSHATPTKFIGHDDTGALLFDANYRCPYGQPRDRLWVREAWRGVVEISAPGALIEHGVARYIPDEQHCRRVEYKATHKPDSEPYRPSIHMPRWASRIALEIVSVRVERLQQIDETGAMAEGVEPVTHAPIWPTFEEKHQWRGYMNYERAYRDTALDSFNSLWRSINGPESWDANPWVWVVEFKRIGA